MLEQNECISECLVGYVYVWLVEMAQRKMRSGKNDVDDDDDGNAPSAVDGYHSERGWAIFGQIKCARTTTFETKFNSFKAFVYFLLYFFFFCMVPPFLANRQAPSQAVFRRAVLRVCMAAFSITHLFQGFTLDTSIHMMSRSAVAVDAVVCYCSKLVFNS